MKRIKTSTLFIAFIAIVLGVFTHKGVTAQGNVSVSLDLFYNELSPHGYWETDANYGDMWYPNVDDSFQPYGSDGYWAMTEYGNTWVSNYDWGWAPFHYGRWVHTPHRGWGWIPGYEWGPAWVDWRSGGGYYGWAPMGPNVSISVGLPLNLWIFLPSRRIYDRYHNRYWDRGHRNIYNRTTIIHNTYVVNNNRYYGGPSRRDVERHLGRNVNVRNLRSTNRPGRSRADNRSVSIYRPERNNNSRASVRGDASNRTRNGISRNNNTSRNDRSTAPNTRISREKNNTSRTNRTGTQNNRIQGGKTSGRSSSTTARSTSKRNEVNNDNVNRSRGNTSGRAVGNNSPRRSRQPATSNRERRTAPSVQQRSHSRSNTQKATPRVNRTQRSAPSPQRSAPKHQRSSAPRVQQASHRSSSSPRVSRPSQSHKASGGTSRSSRSNAGGRGQR